MTKPSILFIQSKDIPKENQVAPEYFPDLNLDQIVESITAYKGEYDLKPFFNTPLKEIDAIKYRHEVMRDLENPDLVAKIQKFSQRMRKIRDFETQITKLHYLYQKERWFLDVVEIYCEAVNALVEDLTVEPIKSRGFIAICNYLSSYVQSDHFITLAAETQKIKSDLSATTYSLLIKGSNIKVSYYESEIDYSEEILKTFAKFKQGAVKDFRVEFKESPIMNHVEAQILDMVAKQFPKIFNDLNKYCIEYSEYLDEVIEEFDREIQFYISYLEFMDFFKQKGLSFCYPKIATKTKDIFNTNGFDLALAKKLYDEKKAVVCNDFYLKDTERIIIISGPNQGGKTTFARTFGQLHYLASIGCPVPGRRAKLFLFDNIFTHFEKEENTISLRGKLEDDLVRIKAILNQATPKSIIIMNEIFNSTTLKDAIILSKNVIEKIIDQDILSVCVTFVDELSSLSEKTVSMVSTVDPENPDSRTYKIIRKPADGLAYAIFIAKRHQLTYDQLKERIKS